MKVLPLFLIALLSLAAGAQPSDSLNVSNVHSLPFTLLSEPAFLPSDRYEPRYFCVLSDTPLDLPPGEDEKSFQMLQGMLGISWDSAENQYVVKQLKLFQSQDRTGVLKPRTTKRIFLLPEKPESDDWSSLHIESDAKSVDSDTERRTVLHLDRAKQTGYIRNILWKSADRSKPPFFDNAYKFRYVTVNTR